ncbi:hypothetical protein [Pseudoalteromonas carrageenovora]|uniref:hypothetical protein n=1 Tax=Pseudoalteromonas carrageenovora TaxID=227 RepID=UPI0026E343C4|nr:hypothetical protein [Pseudoalteromonas carrageenovora]MDO6547647.1 hypothetical protein [Pseudoalteromonas carrageenovora]MDO6832076.1 hypothetical protein [Pseudoalteromonas carrageenovora]
MKAVITATLCVFSAQAVLAQTNHVKTPEQTKPFKSSFELNADAEVGVLSNSALSVQELDDISSQSDSGIKTAAGVNAKWQLTKSAKLTSSYKFEQQDYDEFDQYDLDLHQYGLDGSYSFDGHEIGVRYDGAKANVDGEPFLHFNQASTYYGHFLNPHTYLRMSIKTKAKRFVTAKARNADGVGGDVALYHFINNGQTMLMASLSADKENADDNQYDFNGYGFTTKVTHKFTAFNVANKVGAGWRYQNKDYDEQTTDDFFEQIPSRDEHRNVVNAFYNLALFEHVTLIAEAEYGDYQSKLSSNTYTQSVLSASVKVHF